MKLVKNITITALACIAALLAAEVFLQGAEIQTPMETRIDAEIGPAFVNGKKVTRFNEGFYIGGVNEQRLDCPGGHGFFVFERFDQGGNRDPDIGSSLGCIVQGPRGVEADSLELVPQSDHQVRYIGLQVAAFAGPADDVRRLATGLLVRVGTLDLE